ncbi:unnamed protein product [Ambrosiozyma monospora]|uniref:Unnamed protein product n=1 Tax=Ambrosiozyma monospora TaxID=43982 RepID=A0ACB5U4F1_AMBMO|nr:unnamed protein product [Ambrosiozyma monospora]
MTMNDVVFALNNWTPSKSQALPSNLFLYSMYLRYHRPCCTVRLIIRYCSESKVFYISKVGFEQHTHTLSPPIAANTLDVYHTDDDRENPTYMTQENAQAVVVSTTSTIASQSHHNNSNNFPIDEQYTNPIRDTGREVVRNFDTDKTSEHINETARQTAKVIHALSSDQKQFAKSASFDSAGFKKDLEELLYYTDGLYDKIH